MNRKYRQFASIIIALALVFMLVRGIVRSCNTLSGTDSSGQVLDGGGRYVGEVNLNNPDIHCALGIPALRADVESSIIKRSQYMTSYNNSTHNPNWVSYNLSKWWYGDAPRHRGEFLPDPDLDPDLFHTLHRDYTRSGYDRGHMVRSEERTRNDADNLSTFYTTNLLPQYHELNAGPWLMLEDYCEMLCKREDKELYVVAGPLYEEDRGVIGRDVKVPSSCFKIVVVLSKGQGLKDITANTPVIAVSMPNSRDIASEHWSSYVCTVRDIEARSGMDFLTALPKELQDKVELTRYQLLVP